MDVAKAILFDLDGVLLNSQHAHAALFRKTALRVGLNLPEEFFLRFSGFSPGATLKRAAQEAGRELHNGEMIKLLAWREEEMVREWRPDLFPYTLELLGRLKQQRKLFALITTLRRLAIADVIIRYFPTTFHVIVTGDMIIKPKPAPDPYLKAMQLLSVSPEEGIALEDTPAGIRSAKGAGFPCIALTTTLPEIDLQEADVIVQHPSVESILEAIHSLERETPHAYLS